MGKTIAIANNKGGVGKTTTTINLGAALAKYNNKVLIIDLDEKANATIGLGLKRELVKETEKSSFDVLINDKDIKECIVPTNVDNMWIIPATINDTSFEEKIIMKNRNKIILSEALSSIKDDYNYILIDCPPTIDIIVENALYASDSIIIPVDCEFYSFDALTLMISKINQIQKQKKKKSLNLIIEGILLTKLDNRNLFGYKMIDKINNMFPAKIFNTIINQSSHLQEAPSEGKTILEFAYHSRGSKEYRQLAKEIINRNNKDN